MNRFTITLAAVFLAVGSASADTPVRFSNALGLVMQQAETTYLLPGGTNLQNLLNSDPLGAARVLGFAVQGQMPYARQSQDLGNRMLALQEEIWAFLESVAGAHMAEGNAAGSLTGESLGYEFANAVAGNNNQLARQLYGVDPAQIAQPFILDKVQLSPQDSTAFQQPSPSGMGAPTLGMGRQQESNRSESGRIPFKDQDSGDSISLLGQEATGSGLPGRGTVPAVSKIPESEIQGRWQYPGRDRWLTIRGNVGTWDGPGALKIDTNVTGVKTLDCCNSKKFQRIENIQLVFQWGDHNRYTGNQVRTALPQKCGTPRCGKLSQAEIYLGRESKDNLYIVFGMGGRMYRVRK